MKSCNCGSCAVAGTEDALEEKSCGCGHENQHEHTQDHDHNHDHGQEDHDHRMLETGCGCGCSHGAKPENRKKDIAWIAVALAVAAVGFFVPNTIATAVLAMAAILLVGWPILLQGLKSIIKLDLEEMALMTIAVIAACFIGEYFEAFLVAFLFRIGEMLEDIAVARSRREVEAITKIIPDNANLLVEGGSVVVSAKELAVGSKILIKSGERVPVDSVVLTGSSSVDSSSLTGESAPREVGEGDVLLSGMVNMGGVLTCETTSTFDGSTASKIVEMVRESSAKKGNTERLISKFARIYTPIVVIVAVAVAVLPPLLGFGEFSDWLSRSLVFLVASCPCALVIATPLSFFAGIGAGSKNGILIKGSRYLEALAKADAVVLDKTGTLTTGKLSVSNVIAGGGYDKKEVLNLAAACESYSNHPIAKAIVEAAGDREEVLVEDCEEITSYGMSAVIGGKKVLCGSARLMKKFGVDISALPPLAVYLAENGKLLGGIEVFDNPRPEAAEMVTELENMGVNHVVMLTGDGKEAAEKTAGLVGIRQVEAELLPQDKVSVLEEIKEKTSGTVLFVGDGINDSPVIARADAGIAMGMGSDAAIEAADVVLLSEKLSSLPQAIRIARRTGRLARFNIGFALAVKVAVFVLAFMGMASMWLAVFADVGVTVLSVLNATRALGFK